MFEYTHKFLFIVFAALILASCGGGSSSTNFGSSSNSSTVPSSSSSSSSTNTSTPLPTGNASVFLTWTPPTQNTDNTPLVDLTGYKVYYGITSNNLSASITISNSTASSATVASLASNVQYYFAVKVLNSKNVESDFSNIVLKTAS